MGFLKPKIPAMPSIPPVQPLPEPPSYEDTDRAEAAKAKRDKKAEIIYGDSWFGSKVSLSSSLFYSHSPMTHHLFAVS